MAEWLCCLTRTTKVRCPNLGATRHGMSLDKLLTAVCRGSPGRWGLTEKTERKNVRSICLLILSTIIVRESEDEGEGDGAGSSSHCHLSSTLGRPSV